MVRVGGLTAFGFGLADWFRLQSKTVLHAADGRALKTARSCILLWLDGGPSHLETFDLKPNAPVEVRGPFRPISTNVSGIEVSELLPRMAGICDKLAIIRSMTSPLGEHGIANRYLLTGYKPSPAIDYPSFGSVLTHVRRAQLVLPPYVAIPESRLANAGFLGSAFEPFATGGDPSKPDFRP